MNISDFYNLNKSGRLKNNQPSTYFKIKWETKDPTYLNYQ
jgi:hypothetical protein